MSTSLRFLLCALTALMLAIPMPAQPGKAVAGLRTVVIDPGHGGNDAGCVSADKKTYEKNIALDVAKRLAQKISTAYPEVTVIMTRFDDRFIKLQDRGKIANDAGCDLFISIHVNSTDKGTSANGYSVHCLGKSSNKNRDIFNENLNLVKRENAVVKLEQDYKTSYQGFDPDDPESSIIFTLMQNAHLTNSLDFAAYVLKAMENGPIKHSRGVSQDPFLVLARAASPAVLIEMGFMSNPQDLTVMRSEVGREGIATNIFNAFREYKKAIDASIHADAAPAAPAAVAEKPAQEAPKAPETPAEPAAPVAETSAPQAPSVLYGVQVLASAREMSLDDPFFAGYKPMILKSGKLYKYIIGTSASLKKVKKNYGNYQMKFPDSYIVKIEDGQSSPVR